VWTAQGWKGIARRLEIGRKGFSSRPLEDRGLGVPLNRTPNDSSYPDVAQEATVQAAGVRAHGGDGSRGGLGNRDAPNSRRGRLKGPFLGHSYSRRLTGELGQLSHARNRRAGHPSSHRETGTLLILDGVCEPRLASGHEGRGHGVDGRHRCANRACWHLGVMLSGSRPRKVPGSGLSRSGLASSICGLEALSLGMADGRVGESERGRNTAASRESATGFVGRVRKPTRSVGTR
jgi:hypothetical protein